MIEKWKSNDHQGRSKKSLETSYKILLGSILFGSVILTWGLVYKLIKMIF